MHGEREALVLDQRTRVTRHPVGQRVARTRQFLERWLVMVKNSRSVPPFYSVLTGHRQMQRCEQAIHGGDRPTTDQRHGAASGVAQTYDQRAQPSVHLDAVGRRSKFQERPIYVEEPGSLARGGHR